VDAEQTMKPNLLINIKAWVQFGPLATMRVVTKYLTLLSPCWFGSFEEPQNKLRKVAWNFVA